MPRLTETNELFKIVKWARKQGALLIKVGNVELTFPPDIDYRHLETEATLPEKEELKQKNNAAAQEFIRSNSVLDDPDYIGVQQDKWFESKPLSPH